MFKAEFVINTLSKYKFPITTEKETQHFIWEILSKCSFSVQREFRLSKESIVDFMFDGVAIEVKIKGSATDILRQCRRYCEFECVESLVLVCSVPIGFPPEINGKPVYFLNIGKSWL